MSGSEQDLSTVVTLFKGLADPTRLRMVAAMIERPRCSQDLAAEVGIAPATVSHHLKVLEKAASWSRRANRRTCSTGSISTRSSAR